MLLSRFGVRTIIAVVHDIATVIMVWWLAYFFRFNFSIPPFYLTQLLEILPWIVPVQAGIFLWFGLYRGLWRYASFPDLKRIFLAVIFGTLTVLSFWRQSYCY